ncbi:MAG: HAD family hydrolase [Candidatus Bathyarchaeia archaeon]
MKVQAVLFDLFDTLLLIEGGNACYTPCLRKLHSFLVENGVNVPFEDFMRVYFEVRDHLYMETSRNLEEPHFRVRVWQTLKRLGYNCDPVDPIVNGATDAFAEEFSNYIKVDKEAATALEKLYGKYKLGIVSNFALPECARRLLEKFQLKDFFDAIVISAEINKRKPSPEIFQKALTTIGTEPSKAVFVGDTPDVDIEGAKKVGMKTILVVRKTSAVDWPTQPTRKAEPDKIIKSLKELPKIVEDC